MAKYTHHNQAINTKIVNDQSLVRSIKSGTLLTRGEGEFSKRVRMKGADQTMLSAKDLVDFFKTPVKKKDLIKLVCSYFQIDGARYLFETQLINNINRKITKETIEVLPKSNQEETVTMLFFMQR